MSAVVQPKGVLVRTAGLRVRDALVMRLFATALLVAALGAFLVCLASVRYGLDFTDEGIYLNNYRSWREPELTFTGSSVLVGPIFEVLGWSIPKLRIAKLLFVVGTAAFLGHCTMRFVRHNVEAIPFPNECHAIVVLSSVLGSFSIYAWLPQTPGYNDLAITISAVAVGLTLAWSHAARRHAFFLAGALGFVLVALFLVKWPAALSVAGGIALFLVAAGHRTRFRTFFFANVAGAVVALGTAQLVAGDIPKRIRIIVTSGGTLLRGQSFTNAYVEPYATSAGHTIAAVTTIALPVLIPLLAVAIAVARKKPMLGGLIYGIGLGFLVLRVRFAGFLTGGEANVEPLGSTFPIFLTAAMGVVLFALFLIRRQRNSNETQDTQSLPPATEPLPAGALTVAKPHALIAGVALLCLAPLLQAFGTGNPMFRIAFAAGAAWSCAVAALMVIAVARGGRPAFLPAASGVCVVSIVGLAAGVQALRLDSFRVGNLSQQTVAMPDNSRLAGMQLDPSSADLITQARNLLRREGFLGKPGFSSANGTGLTYALDMPAPLAGLFVEEPLPNVLHARVAEACRIGAINQQEPPVVVSLGGDTPQATTEALRACGISFPTGYKPFPIIPVNGGYNSFRDEGITIWLPQQPVLP
jgi:hypothetical protein